MIPFTNGTVSISTLHAMNGIRGVTTPPLSIPAAPREIGAPHCAHLPSISLRPAPLDVLSRVASGRHPWRPVLVFSSPVRRFQRGLNPAASVSLAIIKSVSPYKNTRIALTFIQPTDITLCLYAPAKYARRPAHRRRCAASHPAPATYSTPYPAHFA